MRLIDRLQLGNSSSVVGSIYFGNLDTTVSPSDFLVWVASTIIVIVVINIESLVIILLYQYDSRCLTTRPVPSPPARLVASQTYIRLVMWRSATYRCSQPGCLPCSLDCRGHTSLGSWVYCTCMHWCINTNYFSVVLGTLWWAPCHTPSPLVLMHSWSRPGSSPTRCSWWNAARFVWVIQYQQL